MNVLIIDDDVLAVQGISSVIQKKELGIDQIFCAYREQEAKTILKKEKIDIALCDIEMPKGSGLDFMAWVRQEGYSITMMILTSHADFQYAAQAIKVGSFDYLLKPVTDEELNSALKRAIQKQKEVQYLEKESRNWKKNYKIVLERYFGEVILGVIKGNWNLLNEYAKQRMISLTENKTYLPILFCMKRWPDSLRECDRGSVQFIMKNIAYELFEKAAPRVVCAEIHERGIVVLLYEKWEEAQVEKSSQSYLQAFRENFQCSITGYRGKPVKLEELSDEIAILKEEENNNISFENRIWKERKPEKKTYTPFDYNEMIRMLQRGKTEQALYRIHSYLKREQEKMELDGVLLEKMKNDLLQAVYVLLKESGVQAHLLLEDQKTKELTKYALLTVEDFENWSSHILKKAGEFIDFVKNDSSVVGKAEQYIKQNLDKIMECEDVARKVCMNSDYLSRLFKREKGMPLRKYINQVRVERAKDLLATTDISVSTIAQMTGYSHFSYFSTAFKKAVNMSPLDYRKQYQRGGGRRIEQKA